MKSNFNVLVHDCSNSIANGLELLQSCTKLSICKGLYIITDDQRILDQNMYEIIMKANW